MLLDDKQTVWSLLRTGDSEAGEKAPERHGFCTSLSLQETHQIDPRSVFQLTYHPTILQACEQVGVVSIYLSENS